MDPLTNPFSPGAGAPPPELAGRGEILHTARVALHRIRAGRPEKGQMLLGLRGVGKTVLLNRISEFAEEMGYLVVQIEAPEGQQLPKYLAPALKSVLLRLSTVDRAKDYAVRALGALRGFASAFKVSVGEIELGVSEPQTADSGNMEVDLPELLLAMGYAAKAAETSVAICIDEVQYLTETDLRGLIVAMHRIAQKGLPVILFGAGLPQVAALAGDAKSYAERLFDYPDVGPLTDTEAARAVREPVHDQGAEISVGALQRIVDVTRGYPSSVRLEVEALQRISSRSFARSVGRRLHRLRYVSFPRRGQGRETLGCADCTTLNTRSLVLSTMTTGSAQTGSKKCGLP